MATGFGFGRLSFRFDRIAANGALANCLAGSLLCGALLASSSALAQPGGATANPSSLDKRVTRIERILEGQLMGEMLDQLEQIQNDTQALRGQIEQSQHQLRDLKRRQKALYQDLDRRLNDLERGGAVAAASSSPVSSSPASSGAQAGEAIQATATSSPKASDGAGGASVSGGAATLPSDNDASQSIDYDAAFSLLQEGRYEQAEQAFGNFLKKYPKGSYAGNASYWLGESMYLQRRFDDALKVYQALIKTYPESKKLPNAKMKMGFVYYEKGDWKQARKVLEEVVASYPKSSAARNAKNRLTQMRREGR